MEAYAEAENPEVPSDLVDKGYGSFIIPNLLRVFYKGKANKSKHSGEIFLNLFCIAIKKFIKD